ncbi:MAG: polysaccharide deacetylase family protein, partial [Myxococcota bacterium]
MVSIEYYEMQPRPGSALPASLPGGFGRGPYPDFRTFSHREYGNRVGVFRVMDVLERQGLRATAAIDAVSACERRVIVEHCLKRRWEIAAHGEAVNRVLSSRLTEEEERAQIGASLEAIERASGVRPSGWHGAEYGESERTPALLAQAGIKYVLDWPNDELPYAMRTPHGPLIAVPMLVDFDDVFAHWQRKLSMARWRRSIAEGVDRLIEDGRTTPRVLVLNLHPWLIGQPWRIT